MLAINQSSNSSRPLSHLPQFCCALHHMVWDIPLAGLRQLSLFCTLPASCAFLTFPLAEQNEKQENPWLFVSTALHQWKHGCVIKIIFLLNPRHTIIPATTKKINSIPAEIRKLQKPQTRHVPRIKNWNQQHYSQTVVWFDPTELCNLQSEMCSSCRWKSW